VVTGTNSQWAELASGMWSRSHRHSLVEDLRKTSPSTVVVAGITGHHGLCCVDVGSGSSHVTGEGSVAQWLHAQTMALFPVLLLTCCVSLGQQLDLSKPHFSLL
jgi:hypothetical protein